MAVRPGVRPIGMLWSTKLANQSAQIYQRNIVDLLSNP